MLGFNKSKKNTVRKKVVVSEESDSDDSGRSRSKSPAKKSVTKKNKEKKGSQTNKANNSKVSSTLSFGDEIEEAGDEQFKIKRSKASLKISAQIKQEKKKKASGIPSEKNVVSVPLPPRTEDEESNTQPAVPETMSVRNDGLKIHTFHEEEDWMEDNSTPALGHGFNSGIGLSGAAIPDASTIYQMKKRREQARTQGFTPEYIPMARAKEMLKNTKVDFRLHHHVLCARNLMETVVGMKE